MIQSKDLRKGNVLDYYGQWVIVLEIKRNENIECGYFNDSVGFERKLTEKHSPQPIPLSEEVLLKCGFEDGVDEMALVLKDCCIYWRKFENHFEINGEKYFKNHLHKLQNLIYEMFNQELTINL